MSIRAKFIVFVNLVVWSTGLALVLATSAIYKGSLEDSFAQAREAEIIKLQAICSGALDAGASAMLQPYTRMLSMQPGIAGAYFVEAGRDTSFTEPGGPGLLVMERPVLSKDRNAGRAVIAYSLDHQARLVRRLLLLALAKVVLMTVLMAALTILGAGLFADRLGRRLLQLREAARQIEEGDFSVRLPPASDELSFFSAHFNQVAEKLATLDQRKDDFIASVSHDLKSPLQCVMGYAKLVMDGVAGPVTAKQRTSLEIVIKSAKQLAALVGTILDISKLEAERMTLNLKQADLRQIAVDVHTMLTVLAQKYELELALEVPEGLPPAVVDAEQVHRVITNLVTNALTITPSPGKVTVRAALEGASAVRFSISDTGPGIPPDKIKSMFTKFFQVEETKKAARKRGTGLGLTICKLLVEAHGGRIWVESEWLKGATFHFTLPLQPAAQAPA